MLASDRAPSSTGALNECVSGMPYVVSSRSVLASGVGIGGKLPVLKRKMMKFRAYKAA